MTQQSNNANRDLVTSAAAVRLAEVYRRVRGHRHWRLGRLIMHLILRLEKGPMYSATARRIMKELHDIDVGAYSYGPFFSPGDFPPAVTIGRYVSMPPGVRVVNENHPMDNLSTHPLFYTQGEHRKRLVIGSDVWIGLNVVILAGCQKVGTGAVIGANAVVTRNVPPYAIMGGVPAKVIRYRFDEAMREKLLASRWWELPKEDVVRSLGERTGVVAIESLLTKTSCDSMREGVNI